MPNQAALTGKERTFSRRDFIVSKTDRKGVLTYVNPTFVDVSGYEESEVVGKPHSIVRHPETPRGIFKFLWDTIQSGKDVMAAVNNRCKNGDHYWVLAIVSPDHDHNGDIVGYHSTRRNLTPEAREVIFPIYKEMVQIEQRVGGKEGMEASLKYLVEQVEKHGGQDGYESWLSQWLEALS